MYYMRCILRVECVYSCTINIVVYVICAVAGSPVTRAQKDLLVSSGVRAQDLASIPSAQAAHELLGLRRALAKEASHRRSS